MKRVAAAALLVGTAYSFTLQRAPLRRASPRYASPLAEGSSGSIDSLFSATSPVRIEGNSLKTWDLGDEATERVQLSIRSCGGRPLFADVELWHTPSYIPTRFSVSCEDGHAQPFHTIIETPKHPKTVAVFNTGQDDDGNAAVHEFPIEASLEPSRLGKAFETAFADEVPAMVQGGQVMSYIFAPDVDSIQVLLKTDDLGKRNMKAMIELTQGPDDTNTIVELYASDGYKNPFYAVLQTPGGATLRIINQNDVEFPFDAFVLPYEMASQEKAAEIEMGSSWA
jgi:hypothetical protein